MVFGESVLEAKFRKVKATLHSTQKGRLEKDGTTCDFDVSPSSGPLQKKTYHLEFLSYIINIYIIYTNINIFILFLKCRETGLNPSYQFLISLSIHRLL